MLPEIVPSKLLVHPEPPPPPIETIPVVTQKEAIPQTSVHTSQEIQKKTTPIPSSTIWFLYIAGFLLILVLVFTALWYFYVKDYNKYKLKSKDEKEDDAEKEDLELDDKPTLLPPPSIIQENFLKETNLQSFPEEELHEAETLIKEESSSEAEEEYFEPKKILEFLEKKKPAKKSYFDLSDIDSSEFVPQPVEKKQIHGKLSDESPEVNEYAEKRANSLK